MHPIKRGVLVVLLSLGAIGGFSHGFARMAQCHGGGCSAPSGRDQFEEHIADVCTRAAQRVNDEQRDADARDHHRHGWGGPQGGPQWGGPQWGGPPGGPQWGGPPGGPQWGGPPPSYWGAPPAPAAAPVAPVVVAPATPATPAE